MRLQMAGALALKARVVGIPLAILVPYLVVRQLSRAHKRQPSSAPVAEAQHLRSDEHSAEDGGTENIWQDSSAASQTAILASVQPLSTLFLEQEVELDARTLWLAAMTHSTFTHDFHRDRKLRDIKMGHWHMEGKELVRRLEYVTPVKKNKLGPKEAWCIEKEVCTTRGLAGFVVLEEAYTPRLPYGGSFHCKTLWVATRVSSKRTKLQISGEVVFTRGCLFKGMITRMSLDGMSDSYAAYKEHLISQVGTLQRGVELSVTSSSERQQQHAPHSMAASMKAHNGAAERSAAFASIILQWLAVFLLCILLYGWWHFSDSPWKAMLCEVLERMVSVKWPEQPII